MRELWLFVLVGMFLGSCTQNLEPVSLSLEVSSQTIIQESTLTLTATTKSSNLSKVAFYDGDAKLGEDESTPYSLEVHLTAAENGEHTYRGVALDKSEALLAESEQTVKVTIAPASVLGVSPADGATGVKADASIVITFDKSANKASVEASYLSDSEGIRPEQVQFSWNEAGTILTITPKNGLEYATNALTEQVAAAPIPAAPETVAAKQYSFSVLGVSHSFATAREITVVLYGGLAAVWNSERSSDIHSRCLAWGACFGDNEQNQEIRSMIVFGTAKIKGRNIDKVRFFGYLSASLVYKEPFMNPSTCKTLSCKFLNAELMDPKLIGDMGDNPEKYYIAAFDSPSILSRRLGAQDRFEGENNQIFTDFLFQALHRGDDSMFIRLRLDTPTNNDGIADISALDMRGETRAALLVSYLD